MTMDGSVIRWHPISAAAAGEKKPVDRLIDCTARESCERGERRINNLRAVLFLRSHGFSDYLPRAGEEET